MKGKKRARSTPSQLGELVQRVYPAREPAELQALRAFGWWDRAVPPRVAANARPVRLSRGTLFVHVVNSSWANELDFLKPQLLMSVNRFAPEANVRAIQFRVGKLPEVSRAADVRISDTPSVPLARLPEEVARALARIASDDLRETVAAAAAVGLAPRPPRERRSDQSSKRTKDSS